MAAELRAIEAEPAGVDIITRLEELTEQAKAGKLSSLAAAIVYRDGTTGRCWSTAPSYSLLIGSVVRLQAAMIRDAEET